MIPAYHWVPKEAFQEISDSGEIIPAIDRLNTEIFHEKCSSEMENLAYQLKGKLVDPIAWKGLFRLIADRIEHFASESPGSSHTFLTARITRVSSAALPAGLLRSKSP